MCGELIAKKCRYPLLKRQLPSTARSQPEAWALNAISVSRTQPVRSIVGCRSAFEVIASSTNAISRGPRESKKIREYLIGISYMWMATFPSYSSISMPVLPLTPPSEVAG